MSIDPHHVHNFWGASPALDLKEVVCAARRAAGSNEEVGSNDDEPGLHRGTLDAGPLTALLVGTSDPRHVFTTLARSRREGDPDQALHFTVHESHMVEVARHVLLISVLVRDDLPPTDRTERFLEIFMNATVRDSTAELIERHAQRLEEVVGAIFAGEVDAVASDPVASIFDFSLLKFKEKDELMDCFRSWSRKVPFDMELARDRRQRKYYNDRFDHRKNVVDWDYHMRMLPAGAGIVHFKHFAQWRLAGIGYPVRESTYPAANRTLVGYARGTTKEFKDRDGEDKGRTIESRGYWGDIINSPYHCFGTAAEETSLFKVANRQHVKNAVEVSEYNVAANLFEMRVGRPWKAEGNAEAGAEAINAWMPDEGLMPSDGEGGNRGGGCASAGDESQAGGSWEGSDGPAFHAAWRKLKITLVGPENFEKNFAARAKHQAAFDVVVVGAWQAQRVTPVLGGTAKRSGGVLVMEGAKYFVFMDKKAATQFAVKSALLADAAGFSPVPASKAPPPPPPAGEDEQGTVLDGDKAPQPVGPGILPEIDDVHRFFVIKPAKGE